ncbi:hypothetical protein [Staphylococcus auricularis]|uniref:hypothetical protein n=1 Tax=Staphylococcus auricularis TaxID=29379 RepID=UPI00177B863F|nr:hypothetical protein [Staphylococcus auricularis]
MGEKLGFSVDLMEDGRVCFEVKEVDGNGLKGEDVERYNIGCLNEELGYVY